MSMVEFAHGAGARGEARNSGILSVEAPLGARVVDARSPNVTEVETPKDRLPPSPPLTPTSSLSSLHQTTQETETATQTTMDTRASTTAEVDGQAATRDVVANQGLDDLEDDNGIDVVQVTPPQPDFNDTSAQTLSFIPHPLNTASDPLGSLKPGPTPSPHGDIPVHASDIHPTPNTPLSETPSSPMTPRQDHADRLATQRPPMPWDLIEPPLDSSDLEERERRMKKVSEGKLNGHASNIVVKDGKKYRIPRSSYYFGPPPQTAAYGSDPVGHLGVHYPREIVRIERDYSGGELAQFSPAYPLELEGRISPTRFMETMNAINELLIEAHSLRWSFLDNALAYFTLYLSRLFIQSHYDKKMQGLQKFIDEQNKRFYNPAGLNICWPKDVAFMFLEIEYY